MARRRRDHIPGERDVDGVATGIVRLHDYYKFNTSSFVEEGVFETEEWRAETTGDLTVWDAFKIGVKGTNHMFLGSGIEIMTRAFDKGPTTYDGHKALEFLTSFVITLTQPISALI